MGRGLITEAQVHAVNEEMSRRLGAGIFSGMYLCYAAPEDPHGVRERKPSPTMLFRARDENNIELAESFMLGDRLSDVRCGLNAGCQSVLVLSGYEDAEADKRQAQDLAHHVAADFCAAVDWILCRVLES